MSKKKRMNLDETVANIPGVSVALRTYFKPLVIDVLNDAEKEAQDPRCVDDYEDAATKQWMEGTAENIVDGEDTACGALYTRAFNIIVELLLEQRPRLLRLQETARAVIAAQKKIEKRAACSHCGAASRYQTKLIAQPKKAKCFSDDGQSAPRATKSKKRKAKKVYSGKWPRQ